MSRPKLTREQKARRTHANQTRFWNERQAAAKTPQEHVEVWFDACRKLAVNAEQNGDSTVAAKLASHLHDFFVAHAP